MKFTGIHHVAFATDDLNRTIRFWRDLLELRLVASLANATGKQYFFALNEESFISFFEWPDVEPVRFKRHGEPVQGPFHFDHLAIGLESESEMLRLQVVLERENHPVSDIVDHGFIHSFYTYDPNGIPLEFNLRIHEVDLVETPVLADPGPSDAAREGPDPIDHFDRSGDSEYEYYTIEGDGAREFGPANKK